eukprot:CAMPEP_0176503754 /NCGR_PEP_ID=MMETSP0200_2-20121128/15543_1 /TAXON_ID=947934 /ORGANISM="Chaetoceros sp., Strain GSL56" /LENGTH=400 /DNA_ID=CAMNT_0017903089 /DNA_START=1085 /DNA_END=2284 /DNA_ORIENTATION=-
MNLQDAMSDSCASAGIHSMHKKVKKRTQRPETDRNKNSREERKRRKTEKKLEKKVRKLKKRRKQKSCEDENLSGSNEVEFITVPSLHVGATPMVITRKIQTMTEEVSFSAHIPLKKRQRFCTNNIQASTGTNDKHSSLRPMVQASTSSKEKYSSHMSMVAFNRSTGGFVRELKTKYNSSSDPGYHADVTLPETPSCRITRQLVKTSNDVAQTNQGNKLLDESTVLKDISVDCTPTDYAASHTELVPYGRDNANQPSIRNQTQTLHSTEVLNEDNALKDRRQLERNKDVYHPVNPKKVSNNYDHNRDASPDVDEHQHRNHHLLERNEPRESVIQILCSEGFFTDSNQAAAELSSGHWCTNLIRQETPVVSNIKFDLRDSRIVDDCGVDIELPDRVGIKVLW